MKNIICLFLIFFLWVSIACAGLLNRYDGIVDFVDGLQIKHGMFYDAAASNWEHVIAGSLWDFEQRDIPLASIEAGYMIQDIGLAMITLNISGLGAYSLKMPIGELGLKIGGGAGYDFRHNEPVYGVCMFGFTW